MSRVVAWLMVWEEILFGCRLCAERNRWLEFGWAWSLRGYSRGLFMVGKAVCKWDQKVAAAIVRTSCFEYDVLVSESPPEVESRLHRNTEGSLGYHFLRLLCILES